MAKIININSFYNHILKIKIKFLEQHKENDITKSLLVLVNIALKEMNENNWHLETNNGKTLQDLYYEEWTLSTPKEKLIFFILLKELKWLMQNDFISWFIEALIFSETNPYYYTNYLTMFLNPEVYNLISEIEATELAFILAKIIEITPTKNILKNDYSTFIYYLSRQTNKLYSPLFKGNYNLNNIYSILKSQMEELNQKYLYFLEKDFQTLHLLKEFQYNKSTLEQEELIRKIKTIESNNNKPIISIIREILKEIKNWPIQEYSLIKK